MNAPSSVVRTVLVHELRNLPRNRGLVVLACLTLLVTESVLRLTGSGSRALVTLLSLVLLIIPLVSVTIGVIAWHASREFTELLLSHPVRRSALYVALYLSHVTPLAATVMLAVALPFLWHHAIASDDAGLLATMLGGIGALTAVFGGIALWIAVRVDDRLRAMSLSLAVWLLLTVVYDGLVLLVATTFSDYSLERPMLALMLGNPVDLTRTLIIMQSDQAALMGYTGAVMHRFLGTGLGISAALLGLTVWILIPAWAGRRVFERRDF